MGYFNRLFKPNVEKMALKSNITGLIKLLGYKKDFIIQIKAQQALEQIGKPAVDLLIGALENKNSKIRESSAEILGKIGDHKAVNPLIRALNDLEDAVRFKSIEALGELGDPQAIEPIISYFIKKPYSVIAQKALINIGYSSIGPLVNAFENMDDLPIRKASLYILKEFKDNNKAFEVIVTALNDKNPPIRFDAIAILNEISDDRAIEPLTYILDDKDPKIRLLALETLTSIIGERDNLIKDDRIKVYYLLKNDDASKCISIGSPAVETLITALASSKHYIRSKAATALGKIGDYRAIEPLMIALSDSDSWVRKNSFYSLESLKDKGILKLESISEFKRPIRYSNNYKTCVTGIGEVSQHEDLTIDF